MLMLVIVPSKSTLHRDDLIALTKDGIFVGYAEVVEILFEYVLLNIDNKASKMFNELNGETIPYDFDII